MTALAIGLSAGLLSGLLGIGGGSIMIPAMVYFMSMSQQMAQGTSLLIIIPTAISSVLIYARHDQINWPIGILIAVSSIVGALIGSHWAQHIPATMLKKMFGIFMILVGIQMLWKK